VTGRQWWLGLSGRRRGLLLGVAGLIVAAVATVLVTAGRSPTADRSQLGAVLLIPGYGGNQGSLAALASRIRETGREAVIVALPGDGTGDLAEQASTLDKAVDDAYDRGASSVDLIGYSAGGVVARLWAGNNSAKARRVITLGSPMHGTRLASSGNAFLPDACPTACRQLVAGSAILESFAGKSLPLPWMSIWTELDETVIPPDSARLDGAVNVALQAVCPGARTSHSQLPTDPAVTKMVLRALSLEPLAQPNPEDCQ
jgi:triacylglycerol lipase